MKSTLRDSIHADLYRYTESITKRDFLRSRAIPGFRYTYLLRYVQYWNSIGGPFAKLMKHIYKIELKRVGVKYGFQIPASTCIGPGFYIGHYGNVVINGEAVIGANVNISPGVTIGVSSAATSFSKPGVPKIGDRVWIGTNAVIVGGIRIGNYSLIAPGALVSIDVPDRSIVKGNPARIFLSEIGSEPYINRVLEK